MTLSENEYKVLNVLLKNPGLSYTEIAQSLDLSVTSVRNLLFSLMEYSDTNAIDEDNSPLKSSSSSYVISEKGKRKDSLSFFAKFNYDLLNFERYDFFLKCSSIKQMQNVKAFCTAHPYTTFRGRVHGGVNGIYVQFLVPNKTLEMLLFSLECFKKEHFIEDFKQVVYSYNFSVFSLLKVDVFSVNENKWYFDFDEFKKEFQQFIKTATFPDLFTRPHDKSILDQLDSIDIMILSEWGYGAGPRKTKAEILHNLTEGEIYKNSVKDLKLNRYIISDHVDSLTKLHIIKHVGIGFDRRKIQILTTLFFIGEAKSEFLNAFANFLATDAFPFEATLSVGDYNSKENTASYTIWVSFTAHIVSKFTEFLFENSIRLQTYIVTYNASDVETYPLYHANFISDSKKWNDSEDYCLRDPLSNFFDTNKVQTMINDFHKN